MRTRSNTFVLNGHNVDGATLSRLFNIPSDRLYRSIRLGINIYRALTNEVVKGKGVGEINKTPPAQHQIDYVHTVLRSQNK